MLQYRKNPITLFCLVSLSFNFGISLTSAFIVIPTKSSKRNNINAFSHQDHSINSKTVLKSSKSAQVNNNKGVQIDDDTGNDDEDLNNERQKFTSLPRHCENEEINEMLSKAEDTIRKLYDDSMYEKLCQVVNCDKDDETEKKEKVYANSYVDLGKVDTVGFDYDYTLVTYKNELLELIYDMTLKRLVKEYQYPLEMLEAGLKFDPSFSVRGLAVDRETAWICHLSYTHKVAVAYEGRERVSRERLIKAYRGKRSLTPSERKKRLKPLNDLFSMAECCLIADVVQFFHDNNIPYCSRNAVVDILDAIGRTHVSGDFHRLVAADPKNYFEPRPHLKDVLQHLKESGKRLIFVSNSPFWYVDAGMRYVIGDNWREMWDATIVSAGKPRFYTESERPFRLVDQETGRVLFNKVTQLEPGQVYAEGCLKELTKCITWKSVEVEIESDYDIQDQVTGGSSLASPNVLYIGDSLFADLVDAKRDFGWTTGAVTPEVGYEVDLQAKSQFTNAQAVIELLLFTLRELQYKLGPAMRSNDDIQVIDRLERMVSMWREEQNKLLGNPFGSVFRAKYTPSLFAHSLRRYCDLYMSNISDLRHYSPQHRFYPDDARLLSHEIEKEGPECWDFEQIINRNG